MNGIWNTGQINRALETINSDILASAAFSEEWANAVREITLIRNARRGLIDRLTTTLDKQVIEDVELEWEELATRLPKVRDEMQRISKAKTTEMRKRLEAISVQIQLIKLEIPSAYGAAAKMTQAFQAAEGGLRICLERFDEIAGEVEALRQALELEKVRQQERIAVFKRNRNFKIG